MTTPDADLPPVEFAFPGPLRDQLVAAIVSGEKTSTSSLLVQYDADDEELPVVGSRGAVIDSAGRPVLVVETTAVEVGRLADVPLAHAVDEGEGYTSVAEWRAGHEEFWTSAEVVAELPDGFRLDDDTEIVMERFRVVGAADRPA
ncbi:ASCH domain-containing protein [Clavibacter michiganensis]|uniref:ASCH domain-containing protein n=1 Tax=Clavibacter michiganensis subsp. insidiosus TaxID=33014 RepID=A0A0D5CFM0_9MICO|nr:ASCH domain-containing protein [Clavibacter michiganensis]AJW78079.1 RNA-binding protein [Clavibacter michiganensis subsp. insidiosus]AWF99533.1 RNA-binding protein [Clavibacter michiganensis subsp. insidiosus]AWG00346.1 RNA-binding protein [Clavibacter michiganensis subsp. insidiosus]OQJ61020.1 RNA-binding protein [Clavibacter michiganensis subsp. insidiosus]RII85075.1 ASCH domain-containing protein [Clavibacter michiganensis subsp. insidiosus]